jgi:hypothetical protein
MLTSMNTSPTRRAVLLSGAASLLAAQSPGQTFLRKSTYEGAEALVMSNDKIDLTILTAGGAFADLVLRDDPEKLSPMWNPSRMAREAGQPPRQGNSRGHFVCVDGFGPVSAEERAAGLPGHGEAHTQPWEVQLATSQGNVASVAFTVKLPILQEIFTRTVRIVDGENVAYVESTLENLLGFDRPVCWAEHATIGSPFLEPGVTVVDMSAKRARTRPHAPGSLRHRLASDQDFTWPEAPTMNGGKVDLRAAPRTSDFTDHTTSLMDPSRRLQFVTALHPGKRMLLGYVFRREDSPWLQTWENYPANGKLARGLEFGTQPFDVPRREVITNNALFDTPTYRWLPAKSKIESRFLMFYTRTPEGMNRIDDVRLERGQIFIEDRSARKQVTLRASLPIE